MFHDFEELLLDELFSCSPKLKKSNSEQILSPRSIKKTKLTTCPSCKLQHYIFENHCCSCRRKYSKKKIHCCICDRTICGDQIHCVKCHVIYNIRQNHCCECKFVANDTFRHCNICHKIVDYYDLTKHYLRYHYK